MLKYTFTVKFNRSLGSIYMKLELLSMKTINKHFNKIKQKHKMYETRKSNWLKFGIHTIPQFFYRIRKLREDKPICFADFLLFQEFICICRCFSSNS